MEILATANKKLPLGSFFVLKTIELSNLIFVSISGNEVKAFQDNENSTALVEVKMER